jgi:hypothetical protein
LILNTKKHQTIYWLYMLILIFKILCVKSLCDFNKKMQVLVKSFTLKGKVCNRSSFQMTTR